MYKRYQFQIKAEKFNCSNTQKRPQARPRARPPATCTSYEVYEVFERNSGAASWRGYPFVHEARNEISLSKIPSTLAKVPLSSAQNYLWRMCVYVCTFAPTRARQIKSRSQIYRNISNWRIVEIPQSACYSRCIPAKIVISRLVTSKSIVRNA